MKHSDIYKKIYPNRAKKEFSSNAQHKADKLKSKLGKYAAVSAALVAVSAPTLDAKVRCVTGLPTTTAIPATGTGSFTIDFDGDGNSDVFFAFGTTGGSQFVSAIPGFNAPTTSALSGSTIGASSKHPYQLAANVTAGPGGNWITSGGGTAFTLNFNDTAGNWAPSPQAGFLGARFVNGTTGDTHYGWVELSITATQIQVLAACYEDCADAGIMTSVSTGDACPQVPTLSEWGLITLAIFLLSFGTLYIGRREEILAAQSSSGEQFKMGHLWQKPPFEWAVFWKTLLATAGLAGIAGGLSLFAYGTIAAADLIGTAIAGPLFAYLMHLLWIFERESKE